MFASYPYAEESSHQTFSTKVVVVPPFTTYNFIVNENEVNDGINRAEKLKWFSLFFFTFGGVFYIVSATWAYVLKKNDIENESDYLFALRTFFECLYGFCWFLNGIFNIWIAKIQSSNMSHILNDLEDDSPVLASLSTLSTGLAVPFLSTTNEQILLPSYREKGFQLSRSVVIGFFVAMAGLLDSITFFFEPYRLLEITVFLMASILWFLLALVAVFDISLCRDWIYHLDTDDDLAKTFFRPVWYLTKVGDFLFLIGASIDIICGIFWLSEDHLQLYSWTVFSAVCWTLDALLYVVSAIIYEMIQKKE